MAKASASSGEGKRFTIRLSSGNGTVRMVCKAIPRQSVGRVAGRRLPQEEPDAPLFYCFTKRYAITGCRQFTDVRLFYER